MFDLGSRNDWKQVTPFLWYCILCYSMGDLIFGIDGSSFGSLQALPSFLNTFGELQPDGKRILPTYRKSLMNSIVYVGRIFGVIIFEPAADRFGYKKILASISVLQVLAVILELTAHEWVQFTVGRIFAYMAMGLIEATIPTYCAEISPPALRGFFSGLFTPLNTISSVWGAGMSKAFDEETGPRGWKIPIAVQMIPAVVVLFTFWWTVESPRWLVGRGRKEDALVALKKLRTKADADSGVLEAEIEAIDRAIEYDKSIREGTWFDLFRGSVWRRSIHVVLFFFFYQVTGNQFYNAYGPSFFVSVGLGSKSFTYAIVVQLVGMIGSWMALALTDRTGRRPLHIFGSVFLIVFDFMIGALGLKKNKSDADVNTIVASFVLMLWSTKVSWATHCYMMTAEMGGVSMRRKLVMLGVGSDVIWAFAVSFSAPYIMNHIGAGIGYIFGGSSIIALIYAILFLPELAGRGLEEVDELFESPRHRWGWQFKGAKTTGFGATIAELEMGHGEAIGQKDMGADQATGSKADVSHIERK